MEPNEFWNKIRNDDKIHLIFLCGGNICRSPFAEMKFEQLLADSKIKNKVKFVIQSGGFINQKDVKIHPFTVKALLEDGIPNDRIVNHFPRRMRKHKDDLINASALIVMTEAQRDIQLPAKYRDKAILLSTLGIANNVEEIPDPAIIKEYPPYREIMDQITSYLMHMIKKMEDLHI
jgi:protein-tyrosine-phosphatase